MALENEGFPQNAHEKLFAREENHFWFQNRNQLIRWILKKYLPQVKSFCEVGCGTGFVLSGLAEERTDMQLTGTEIYSSALPFAAKRLPNAQLLQADLCDFPFDEEFGAVGAFDVLEHINDDQLALNNIFRALKPGGGVIITVPQHQWLWSSQDDQACHKRRYSRKELKDKMEAAGFVVSKMSSFVALLLPLMVLSRLRLKCVSPKGDGSLKIDELAISPFLNSCFKNMCSLERWFIRHGFSFPMGGSLLAVGRKD